MNINQFLIFISVTASVNEKLQLSIDLTEYRSLKKCLLNIVPTDIPFDDFDRRVVYSIRPG